MRCHCWPPALEGYLELSLLMLPLPTQPLLMSELMPDFNLPLLYLMLMPLLPSYLPSSRPLPPSPSQITLGYIIIFLPSLITYHGND